VLRATADVEWSHSILFGPGMIGDFHAGFAALGYVIGQDPTYEQQVVRLVPQVSAGLRWPLTRIVPGGSDLLEPVIQAAWSDVYGPAVPNEDSRPAEFDGGNLLALSRFSGGDAEETGFRIAAGVNWRHDFASVYTIGASVGRIFRIDVNPDVSDASGLNVRQSDWLFAFQAQSAAGLALNSRLLLDPSGEVTKASAALDWSTQRYDIAASYDWVIADLGENRPDPLAEIAFDTTWRINDFWSTSLDARFDPRDEQARNASVGLTYQNECITVDLAIERRFTASTSADATTDVNLRVALGGFGEKAGPARRVCGR
jgi:LPS-assembly protein